MTDCVRVHLDELIIGREVTFPIHGTNGLLLLGRGARITSDVKQRLKARGVTWIIMNEADVSAATLGQQAPQTDEADDKLADRLDSILRSSGLGISNDGPALAKQVKRHGCKNYDGAAQQEMKSRQQESGTRVNEMMEKAAAGGEVDGDEVDGIAASCIGGLTADFDGALSMVMGDQDNPTLAQHAMNLSMMAMAIGVELGLDADNVRTIGIAGLVQDWGMAKVPKQIRDLERPLTAVEFLEIQKHPVHTLNLLDEMKGIPNIVKLVAYQSHERLDGSGYPRGRSGASIHFFSRVLHVADSYVAMTALRPHRPSMMPYAAMECLLDQAKRQRLEPEVVRSLLHILSLFPIGSFVALSDGSAAQVIRSSGIDYTRPIVLRVQDKQGSPVDPEDESAVIDLSDSDLRVAQALPAPGQSRTAIAS